MRVEVFSWKDQLFSKWGTGTRFPMTCSCFSPARLSVPCPQLLASFLRSYSLVFNIYYSNPILGYHRLYIYIVSVCLCLCMCLCLCLCLCVCLCVCPLYFGFEIWCHMYSRIVVYYESIKRKLKKDLYLSVGVMKD